MEDYTKMRVTTYSNQTFYFFKKDDGSVMCRFMERAVFYQEKVSHIIKLEIGEKICIFLEGDDRPLEREVVKKIEKIK